MDVEDNTPAPAVEVSEAPKGGKMSVEDALQQVLKNAMVGWKTHGDRRLFCDDLDADCCLCYRRSTTV